MPPDRLSLRVPDTCRLCHTHGAVKLEQTVKGEVVALMWCCSACDQTWPVTSEDERHSGDSRRGPVERRSTRRGDRRADGL